MATALVDARHRACTRPAATGVCGGSEGGGENGEATALPSPPVGGSAVHVAHGRARLRGRGVSGAGGGKGGEQGGLLREAGGEEGSGHPRQRPAPPRPIAHLPCASCLRTRPGAVAGAGGSTEAAVAPPALPYGCVGAVTRAYFCCARRAIAAGALTPPPQCRTAIATGDAGARVRPLPPPGSPVCLPSLPSSSTHCKFWHG